MGAPCTLERRFEDCRGEDRETHRDLWSAVNALRTDVNRLTTAMATSRGAALALHGLVTLACTAGGVALIKWLMG